MGLYAFHFMHAFRLHTVSISLIYELMTSLVGSEREDAEVMLLCEENFWADDQSCTSSSQTCCANDNDAILPVRRQCVAKKSNCGSVIRDKQLLRELDNERGLMYCNAQTTHLLRTGRTQSVRVLPSPL